MICDEDGTRVETPAVKPQGDGIHFEIVNNAAGERSFSLTSAEGGGMGLGAPPGTSSQIVDFGPGPLTVSCTDPAVEVEGGKPLEIVDEDGIRVPTTLGCPDQFSQVVDYVAGAKGETSDPIEAARKAVEGYRLEADDVFERAGYPDAETVRVRLVRNGENLAVIDLMDDGTGKWLVGMVTGCSSSKAEHALGSRLVIEAHTLTDGGQPAIEVAERLAGFLGAARTSLDLALYDFDLPPTAKIVAGIVVDAEKRGVAVRLAFNVDSEKPPPLFPPPTGEPTLIDSLEVPTKPIPGVPD